MEIQGPTTKTTLLPTPGVTLLTTGASSPGRAHLAEAGREFLVQGSIFYELDSTGLVLTNRGTLATDSKPATICANGSGQIFITSGGNGYCFALATNLLTQITALNGKARQGAMLDGYFLAIDTITSSTTPTVYISNLADGLTWDPTRFIQRSAASDPWVAMTVVNRYIWFLGQQTSEVWYDAGSSPIPFVLHPSGLIPFGCAAAFSVAVADGSLAWLAQTANGIGAVVEASGFGPESIATYPVQRAITLYTSISDAVADMYTEQGHTFYILTFPTDQATWGVDMKGQAWHKRGSWIAEEGRYRAWRPRWHAFAFGQHRWLDGETGAIYVASVDVATDVDSRPLRRVRRAPALVQENQRVTYAAFELDLERGQGLVTGQGSNPQVMLRWSDDNGQTWSNEHWRTAGAKGKYSVRVRWNRLGQARRRMFEVVMSDPTPWKLTNAYLEIGQVSGRAAPQQGQQQGAA